MFFIAHLRQSDKRTDGTPPDNKRRRDEDQVPDADSAAVCRGAGRLKSAVAGREVRHSDEHQFTEHGSGHACWIHHFHGLEAEKQGIRLVQCWGMF